MAKLFRIMICDNQYIGERLAGCPTRVIFYSRSAIIKNTTVVVVVNWSVITFYDLFEQKETI